MIGKKIKAKVYPNSRYPEILTVLDKVRGVYIHTPLDTNGDLVEGSIGRVLTIDYYICKHQDGTIHHIKPTSIQEVLEEDKRPEVRY